MSHKSIVVCPSDLILGTVVMQLLSADPNLEIIAVPQADEGSIAAIVTTRRPGLVILVDMPRLCSSVQLLHLIGDELCIPLVELSSDDNWARVYPRGSIFLSPHTDLVSTVRDLMNS